MKIKILFLAAILMCASGAVAAQTKVEVKVKKAELSVPFGTVYGKLAMLGDHLLFIDEEQMDSSFAIARGEIQNITSDGGMVNIETRQPVRDRSGERSRFSFRLIEGDLVTLINWSQTTPSATQPAAGATAAGANAEQMSFPAQYSRRFGRNSRGRLIVSDNMIAYESTDRLDTSRRWQLKDIKEIKLKNPYEVEINPFVGGKYTLRLEGKGMDNSEFKTIVDRITAARIAR
jgi:hypothetical protein